MKVKIVFGSDIRRWHAPAENRYEALLQFIQNTFHFPDEGNFFLQFEDDEGDRMTLSSANDLNDAFVVAEQDGRKSLKIFLIPVSIQEARQDALSQFSGARSVASLDQFEVVSNPQSHAESASASIEVPELDDSPPPPAPAVEEDEVPQTWQEGLSAFLANEAVNALLPDFVKAVMIILRTQPDAGVGVAVIQVASRVQFEAIDQHPFFEHFVKPNLDVIALRASQLLPILLAFDDDHIASIVPQLIETGVQMLSGMPDAELDVTPIFATMFPSWMSMMNTNNPDGATVDLSHIFGCSNAAEAAAAMMGGMEKKDDDAVHEGVSCDMCNAGPIRGPRYKCCVCSNFDLCGACEATGTHNKDHPLLKLSRPCRGLARSRMHGLREMFGRGRCGGWRKWRGDDSSEPCGPPPHGPHGHPFAPPFGGPHHPHHHPHHPHPHGPPPHHGHHGHGHGPWGRHWRGFGPQFTAQSPCASPSTETSSVCSEATVRTENGRKLKASFIEDVNIPDRSHYRPGLVLEKVWRMKNNGPNEWGNDCSLVFVKGCRNMTLEERFPVPNAAPGAIVEVSAMIRTPETNNRYCAYYRLERDGSKFGPRVWVDIFVTDDESKLGEANYSREELKQLRRQDKLQKKQDKLVQKQARVEAELAELNERIEVAAQPEGPSLSCLCGSKMVRIHHKKAYRVNARINCDICGKLAQKRDDVYHCPNEFSPLHPEGYDLCVGCGQDQLKVAAKTQVNEAAVEMKEEVPPEAVEVVEENATEVINPTAPPEVVPSAPESGFPFQDALNTVMQMGFADESRIKYLLMDTDGNVETVVQRLLSSV